LQVSASSLHSDAVSVYHVEDAIPGYFELRATVEIVKPTGGWDANAYMIFDYISPTDFKFVGLDEKINKLVIGHRDASGWHIDKQGSVQGGVKSGKAYNMLVAVNGLNVVLVVDNQTIFTHTFAPRVIDGYSYGLNYGLVGMGSNNSRGTFDNVAVQILPPQLTLQAVDDFAGSPELSFDVLAGSWNVNNSRYATTTTTGVAMSVIDLGIEHLNVNSYLELKAKVNLNGAGRLRIRSVRGKLQVRRDRCRRRSSDHRPLHGREGLGRRRRRVARHQLGPGLHARCGAQGLHRERYAGWTNPARIRVQRHHRRRRVRRHRDRRCGQLRRRCR
jgi:hypothetical protein